LCKLILIIGNVKKAKGWLFTLFHSRKDQHTGWMGRFLIFFLEVIKLQDLLNSAQSCNEKKYINTSSIIQQNSDCSHTALYCSTIHHCDSNYIIARHYRKIQLHTRWTGFELRGALTSCMQLHISILVPLNN